MAFTNTAVGTQLADVRQAADVNADAQLLALSIKEAGALAPRIVMTVSAEDTNVIIVTGQLKDGADNDLAGLCKFKLECIQDADGILALVGVARISDGGVGTEVYGAATPSYAGITDSDGAFDVDVLDVAGASGKSFWIHCRLIDVIGAETISAIVTFD